MGEASQVAVTLGNNGEAAAIFGQHDENLRLIEANSNARLMARGNQVHISGSREEVAAVSRLLQELLGLKRAGGTIDIATVRYALKVMEQGRLEQQNLAQALGEVIFVTPRGKQIRARTLGQLGYLRDMRTNDMTFAIGPAGTGKTYLAVVMAVEALKAKQVSRIILARPAVEAGEKLGFLPGDLQEKINPYLRPIYDSLYDILGMETAQKYMERNVIEVAPLAYMRGRTLDEAFAILDEAQNTTPKQMKMFLTRLGAGSRAVITGDVTQVDLPPDAVSGLVHAREVLQGIPGIAFSYLTADDVVRHPLVQRIIQAYEGEKSSSS